MDWLDLLAVQGTLKCLLQHHGSKASVLQRSAFFIVQLSHPYMTTGKKHSFGKTIGLWSPLITTREKPMSHKERFHILELRPNMAK